MKVLISVNTFDAINAQGDEMLKDVGVSCVPSPTAEQVVEQVAEMGLLNVDAVIEDKNLVLEIDDEVLFAMMRAYKRMAPVILPIVQGLKALNGLLKLETRELEAMIMRRK